MQPYQHYQQFKKYNRPFYALVAKGDADLLGSYLYHAVHLMQQGLLTGYRILDLEGVQAGDNLFRENVPALYRRKPRMAAEIEEIYNA